MQPDHRIRTRRSLGDRGDVQVGGVGGEDRVGAHHGAHGAEHLALDGNVLEHGFDDEVGLRQRCVIGGSAQRGAEESVAPFGGELAALHASREDGGDALAPSPERPGVALDQGDGQAGQQGGRSDARPHGPAAHDTERVAMARARSRRGWVPWRPRVRQRRCCGAPAIAARSRSAWNVSASSAIPAAKSRPALPSMTAMARAGAISPRVLRAVSACTADIAAVSGGGKGRDDTRRTGSRRRSRRNAVAKAMRSPVVTASTTPSDSASAAPTRRPDAIIAAAAAAPISRGRRCVPPAPGISPRVTSGRPTSPSGSMTRRWQASASSSPPPSVVPWSTAHDRLAEILQRREGFGERGRDRRLAELRDVGARDEGPARPAQHRPADRGVVGDAGRGSHQPGPHGLRSGVDRRIVDRDQGDVVADDEVDDFAHRSVPLAAA